MAAADVPTLFNQAVSRILSSWAALQIAVENGFGGSNSKQKAQDLVNDIERLFQAKKNLDPYDFAGYLEDEVDDRFDLVVEDGSVDMIATHICQCSTLLKEGRIPEVEQFLQGLPGAGHSRVQCAGGDSSSEEDDDDENMDNSSSQPQQRLSQQQQQCSPLQNQSGADGGETSSEMPSSSTNGAGDAPMDVEEEDGWTVVRKGGRKR
ncbi:pre-rRNA-processing protein TSR2 homolog [Babylonia areolata]|uniref:pre-rRNA-processing protein TSR2 homolog n=1 Tax=Babylonia areolata TaxID=304850 RepID=UPI003FD462AA